MRGKNQFDDRLASHIFSKKHCENDYFGAILLCIREKKSGNHEYWQSQIERIYNEVSDEIRSAASPPKKPIQFGTSGWRGILGKELNLHNITGVSLAIIDMYKESEGDQELLTELGVVSYAEAQKRGCVLGHDNRFGNELFARRIMDILSAYNFKVYFAGESTTGTLSAAVLELNAAFSINLTPSHNPLDYGGFKFNAADGGPAAKVITDRITRNARKRVQQSEPFSFRPQEDHIVQISALNLWKNRVLANKELHGIDYHALLADLKTRNDLCLVVDAVHGASRGDLANLLDDLPTKTALYLRTEKDQTFGGISPEPSDENLQPLRKILQESSKPLKLGVIMDPDADRIRFTDGTTNIDMNKFGAMSYHFLHTHKKKRGLVAKSVATSNFVTAIAEALHEEVFEPPVGFKEFKPVIGSALVCFEESDGITVIGHTPEKDAYIGLMLALDMTLTLGMNLGEYLAQIESEFGAFFPGKDGVPVCQQGAELAQTLKGLDGYVAGQTLSVGATKKTITAVRTVDGHKFIFDDASWLMIRPSGTEPKIRFYVEGRSEEDRKALFATAQQLLEKLGLL